MGIIQDNDLDNIILGREVISKAKSVLNDREFDMLVSYATSSISYRKLGQEYGITGTRALQIINKAIVKVQKQYWPRLNTF